MPDPLSVIGSIGALCNIIDVVGKTILKINELCVRWKDADLTFLSLAAQLTALRAALMKIEEWTDNDIEDFHHQLIMDLDVSLSSCKLLVTKLDHLFCEIERSTDQELDVLGKIQTLRRTHGLEDVQKLIERQISALNLLLTACTCKTLFSQTQLLQRADARKVLERPKADSVSLLVHRDATSLVSKWSDNLSKISVIFSFDRVLFSSRVYERAFRDSFRDGLKQERGSKCQDHILLVGDDESGKADFVNLMHERYGTRFWPKDVAKCRSQLQEKLRKDCLDCLTGLLKRMEESGTSLASASVEAIMRVVANSTGPESADPDAGAIAKVIDDMQQDPGVRRMLREDQKHGKPSIQGILHQARRLESSNFVPTAAEIFCSRAAPGKQVHFQMPLQQNEQAKRPTTLSFTCIPRNDQVPPIPQISGILNNLAVLVVDVATYDADPFCPRLSGNQLMSSLNIVRQMRLLKPICLSMVIILNNLDRFKEKFKASPAISLGRLVHDSSMHNDPSAAAIEWIKHQFRQAFQGDRYPQGALYICSDEDIITSTSNLTMAIFAGLDALRLEVSLQQIGFL